MKIYKITLQQILRVQWVLFPTILFQSCLAPQYQVTYKPREFYKIESSTETHKKIEKIILPYRTKLEKEMGQTIAMLKSPAVKGKPESTLGNLTCDILLRQAQVFSDTVSIKAPMVCLLNSGGLRAPLPTGNITVGHVFELMPFENRFVALLISQENFQKLCSYVAEKGGEPLGGFKIKIHQNSVSDCTIGEKKCGEFPRIWTLTSDYLADGGDKMIFFKNPIARHDLHVTVRDALIEGLKRWSQAGKIPLEPSFDQRISHHSQ